MHSQGIANKVSKRTRNIVREDQGLGEMATIKEWETGHGGRYKATGVGGMIAGSGGHLLIADDLFPDRKHAESQVYRDTVHDWWQDDFITRRNPQMVKGRPRSPIVLIMCMTGDTPVMMADGNDRPLRDIKQGDSVATFDDGRLRTSRVLNHASNGCDFTYKITTTSGRIVRANERHPFLVEEHGVLKWVKMKDLSTASRIVTVKGNGENGKARHALFQGAKNQLAAVDCALATTARSDGQMGTEQHRTTQDRTEKGELSTGTVLHSMTTMPCLPSKTEGVASAGNRQARTCGHTGAESCVSTTATKPIKLEDCSATTAIWPLAMPSLRASLKPLLPTSDFISELIEKIEPDGYEEVFDVQIEHTENFIANGVVSHNTRWHTDDIWGRVVNPEEWLIRRLPAICDYDPLDPDANIPDPLGREWGDALAPRMWPASELENIRINMSEYSWLALFQGRPTSKSGMFFDVTQLDVSYNHTPTDPPVVRRVRYYDFASSPDPDAAYTATVLMAVHKDGTFTIEHMDKIQKGPGERNKWQRRYANMDAKTFGEFQVKQIEERQPGAAGKDRVIAFVKLMRGHSAGVDKIEGEGSKTTRADPFAGSVAGGIVRIARISPWGKQNPIEAFKNELRAFPMGKLKDWVDAGSGAHNFLIRAPSGVVGGPAKRRREELIRRRGRR